MSAENFDRLKPVPILTDIKTRRLPEVRFSPNLDFAQLTRGIRFNVQLIVGGQVRIDQCQFQTPGIIEQTIQASQQQINIDSHESERLSTLLPEAIANAKGRKRFLGIFTYGKTEGQKEALKNKREVMKRQNKEAKAVEKKFKKKNKELKQFSDKNSITVEQRILFDRIMKIQDFLQRRSKVRHQEFKQVKSNLRVLGLPLDTHISRDLNTLLSHVRLLVPKYDQYVQMVNGYEEDGKRVLGLKDYERQLGRIIRQHQREMKGVDREVTAANNQANLAEDLTKLIQFHFERLGDAKVLISRLILTKSYLNRVYINEGPEVIYAQLQQARNDLSELKERVGSQRGSRDGESVAVATSRVKELEKNLEIAVNPWQRLNQEDAPRDLRAALRRVTSRNYNPTRVTQAERVFDDLVLTLLGKKSAAIISPTWQDQTNIQSMNKSA